MRSINLKITFETRRELGVLMIDEPGNNDLYEVIGRARQVDRYGAEDSTMVLTRRLADDPSLIISSDYTYAIGYEVETEIGRKFQLSWTPSQSTSNLFGLPVAVGEFLLHAAVTGTSQEIVLREDFSRFVADAAGLPGRAGAMNG